MRRILTATLALAALPSLARAQSIWDSGLHIAPQVVHYEIKSPTGGSDNTKITETAIPLFALVPATSWLSFDVGTSYANARVESNSSSGKTISTINGLTDTQVRANMTLGADFLILTAGLNLPTGRETAKPAEQVAATRIASDFLSFPISNLGTGFGATAGLAVARPVGSWNLGFGASMRRSSEYDPFQDNAGNKYRFQPGNEYRARVGVDHPYGAGRVSLGFTFSKFGDDQANGSIYNTGDRYITSGAANSAWHGLEYSIVAWNLYRTPGTLADSSVIGHEDVFNTTVAVGIPIMGSTLQPSIEFRNWSQNAAQSSQLVNFGASWVIANDVFALVPSAGYTYGKIAFGDGRNDLTGYRAALSIRIGH
ncbi:MAG: hypothetical protein JWO05_637 [Gemmatimonadetes bacterium]|nr:hypothetical protein [Gemmatimonadota bacterium]